MLFLAIFWNLIAGLLELLMLASGYALPALVLYILSTIMVYYLGKAAGEGGE